MGSCQHKEYIREEVLSKHFGEVIGAIKMDPEVTEWVLMALKESHIQKRQFHNDTLTRLQGQYQQLQKRLDEMYLDKLDGRVSLDFFDKKSAEWRSEQESIRQRVEAHESADQNYLDDGVKLIELSQKAVSLYEKQEMLEKRRLLNFVVSNSIWKEGRLEPVYRKPFDLLVDTNRKDRELRLIHGEKMDFCPTWLGD